MPAITPSTSHRRLTIGMFCAGVLTVASLMLLPQGSARAADVLDVDYGGDSILIIAPHPDDDILLAAGIASNASNVTVAYMTNGDWCETLTVAKDNAAFEHDVDVDNDIASAN